jgi:hypothetical protein
MSMQLTYINLQLLLNYGIRRFINGKIRYSPSSIGICGLIKDSATVIPLVYIPFKMINPVPSISLRLPRGRMEKPIRQRWLVELGRKRERDIRLLLWF